MTWPQRLDLWFHVADVGIFIIIAYAAIMDGVIERRPSHCWFGLGVCAFALVQVGLWMWM